MKRIQKNLDYLKVLSCCSKKMSKSIISNGPKELIDAICECVLNLLIGNINLEQNQKDKLYKYRNSLRKLLKNKNLKQKKQILVQNGGFLQILLPSIISGLASIVSSVISSNKE